MLVNGNDFYCGSGNGITTQIAKFSDLDSLKTSVSNGKSLIASAITDKGISTASDATFQTMANNISQLDIRQHAKLVITVVDVDGTPLVGYKINGITGVDSSKCITQSGGIVSLTDVWGTFYCTVPDVECIDAYMPQTTISLADGETKSVEMRMVSRGVNELSITESKNIKFSNNVKSVDVFCVGGGASGGTGNGNSSSPYSYGNGGSGGFTKTVFAVTIVPHKLYSAIIGKGGASPTSYGHKGNPGESSSFLGVEAAGGSSTSGGSGGGAGGYIYFTKNSDYYYDAGAGGSDGSNGGDSTDYRGTVNKSGIPGQGTTTRAFGQSSGTLYSGGGGGGDISKTSGGAGGGGDGAYVVNGSTNVSATNGTPNTGGGGGGGYCSQLNAGSGGSGIILCRLNLKS